MALTHLQILAKRTPNVAAALAELSQLEAVLTLPTPTVHVVSDVHGEHVKLRQVINNASGSLRPLFERLFAGLPAEPPFASPSGDADVRGHAPAGDRTASPSGDADVRGHAPAGDRTASPSGDADVRGHAPAVEQLLTLVYYPHESWAAMTRGASEPRRRELLRWAIGHGMVAVRALARRYSIKYVERIVPDPFDPVFRELVFSDELARQPAFLARLLEPFVRHRRDGELVRAMAHVIRNLAVGELIVAGDLGDRGPRIDKVIDLLVQQPRVAITWGNHDVDWMAACLGHPAAIATVIRLSLRYQRLAQLEDGYGISLDPVARLVREAYADDPAACFELKGELGADAQQLARMQKAISVLQFKLEGQMFERRPEWGLGHRALLRNVVIDPGGATGTVEVDGARYPLRDTRFPTVDWGDPLRLSDAEARCLAALTQAFVGSRALWQHMSFIVAHGRMSLRRDLCAIFHGCVPVDVAGEPLAFTIDGEPRRGRALFEAFETVVQRAFRGGADGADELDKDLIFYLWTGPSSPCFGKDRMSTFETYLIADSKTHHEAKNPYFQLLNDPAFCGRILTDFGVDPTAGFIINGHVPVKLEAGEAPIKKSGRAITIDGAFAAAYGDKGFSLVLDAERIYLAQHHHFESAAAAVSEHADIVPTVSDVVVHARPRTVGDTEVGDQIRAELAVVGELVHAFEANIVRERP